MDLRYVDLMDRITGDVHSEIREQITDRSQTGHDNKMSNWTKCFHTVEMNSSGEIPQFPALMESQWRKTSNSHEFAGSKVEMMISAMEFPDFQGSFPQIWCTELNVFTLWVPTLLDRSVDLTIDICLIEVCLKSDVIRDKLILVSILSSIVQQSW